MGRITYHSFPLALAMAASLELLHHWQLLRRLFLTLLLGHGQSSQHFLTVHHFEASRRFCNQTVIHLPAMVNDVAISDITIFPKHSLTLGKIQRFKPRRNGFTLRQRCCIVALLQNHRDSSPYLSSFRLEPLLCPVPKASKSPAP